MLIVNIYFYASPVAPTPPRNHIAKKQLCRCFPTSSRFLSAVQLINSVPASKLAQILKRLSSKIHLRDSSYFTPSEVDSLSNSFGLTTLEMSDVLNASGYVLEQCMSLSLKEEALESTLLESKMDKEAVAAFKLVWMKEGKDMVKRMMEASDMGMPLIMKHSEWTLAINVSNSGLKSTKEASATLDLELEEGAGAVGGKGETLALEFSHAELYGFFRKLDTIQQQLDNLI